MKEVKRNVHSEATEAAINEGYRQLFHAIFMRGLYDACDVSIGQMAPKSKRALRKEAQAWLKSPMADLCSSALHPDEANNADYKSPAALASELLAADCDGFSARVAAAYQQSLVDARRSS